MKIKKNIEDTEKVSTRDKKPKKKKKGCLIGIAIFVVLLIIGALNSGDSRKDTEANQGAKQKVEQKAEKKVNPFSLDAIKKIDSSVKKVKMNGQILEIDYDEDVLSAKSAYNAFVLNSIDIMKYLVKQNDYKKLLAVKFTQPGKFIDDKGHEYTEVAISASINVENSKDVNWDNMNQVVAGKNKYKFFKLTSYRMHPGVLKELPYEEQVGLRSE